MEMLCELQIPYANLSLFEENFGEFLKIVIPQI